MATIGNMKPAIVLIHGAWHVPDTYEKLATALRTIGYEVHVPRLPSVSEVRPPTAGLSADSELVRSVVENLANSGRTIIAVMHSYGGQVGSNALHGLGLATRAERGLPGGVSHLVYMCAFALPEGGTMAGKVKEFNHEHLLPLTLDIADDQSVIIRDPKTMLIGEDGATEAEIETYLSTLLRWNAKCMSDELAHAAWREIPVSYIYATNDMMIPLDYQKSMVDCLQANGCSVETFTLETGHCPNLTATHGVVDVINKVAAIH
ncbi:AB hydrolase-1 domain-containing protein [Madurella fahalii]|uniref:AB hydrolase-1 domain-containing protein n=1 Tax=Madurella fahalii TaxID=1157608 RepID=A0ABQ0GJI8_9PEZI